MYVTPDLPSLISVPNNQVCPKLSLSCGSPKVKVQIRFVSKRLILRVRAELLERNKGY